jgi:copper chaperone
MITLKVPDMSCSHCVRTIDGAVKAVDPQALVEADLGAHTVSITSSADDGVLRQAVAEAGYDNEKLAA